MEDDHLLLLKNCVEDESVDSKVRHSSLRVLLKLIEHRSTAESMIANHMLALLASMLRPKVRDVSLSIHPIHPIHFHF